MFEQIMNAPDGVKLFLLLCALVVIGCTAAATYLSIKESKDEKPKYRRGHA